MQNSAKINYPKVAGGHRASYRLAKNLYSHRAQNRLASATLHSAFSAGFAPPVLHRNSGQDSRKVETSCTETPAANGVLSPRNEKKIIFSFVFRSLIRNFAHKKNRRNWLETRALYCPQNGTNRVQCNSHGRIAAPIGSQFWKM